VSIQRYSDVGQFFAADESLVAAEVDFAWSLAVEKREALRRFRNLALLSFGPNAKIETCEAVDELQCLKSVWLIGQHRLRDFSALARLPELADLRVTAAWELDLGPLSAMRQLGSLLLDGPRKGYSVINTLDRLVDLKLYAIKIKDLECISNLRLLRTLEARAMPLKTLEGMPSEAPIEHLNVSQTAIKSVEPAASLKRLEVLWMTKCRNIKELGPAAGMRRLKELYLNDIPGALNLGPLTECPKLEVLFFYGTKVTSESLRALKDMKSLKRCEFSLVKEGDYSIEDIQSFAPQCRFRIITPNGKVYMTTGGASGGA
jgi:hypothetical protein